MKNNQFRSELKLTLQWITGVICTMSGISILLTYPITSLGFFIMGFTCIPPIRSYIESKWIEAELTPAQRYIWVLVGYAIVTTSGLTIQGQNLSKLREIKESKTIRVRDTITVVKHDTIIKTVKQTVTVVEKAQPSYGSSGYGSSSRGYSQSGYIRGPRGGCYYINSRGNKVYVDRSLCD